MEIKIIQKKDEPLLSRTKIESEIMFENETPSRQDVHSNLAKSLAKDEKLLVVKGIYTLYGSKKARVLSYSYDDEKSKEMLETKTKKGAEQKAEKKEVKEEAKQKKEEKKEASPEAKKEAKPKQEDKKEAKEKQ